MSIYTNPVYDNPTVPYTKLKEDEKPQLLHGLILPSNSKKDYYRRRHRFASAVSCLLCTLAITLTFLAAVLALYGVFGRCFQAQDVDSDDFEQFMRMLQPNSSRNSAQQKGPFSQRIMPFPKKVHMLPGPMIPSPFGNHKILHAMCPVMNMIECHRETFDGYSLKEHQQRVDLLLGKSMLKGRLNTSYAVNTARHAYKQCVKDFDGDKQPLLRHFAIRLMEVQNYKHRSEDPATLNVELATLGRLEFGIDTLFKVEISANYLAPDGQHPYIIYFDQKLPAEPSAAQMSLMRRAFHKKLNESNYQQMYLNVPRLREMGVDSDDSMSWQSFTAAEAYARWPFFDFHSYLSHLNSMQRFAHNVKETLFVVKTPNYFDKLNAFFLPKNKDEVQQKVDLFKIITMYNIFADNAKYLGIENEENEIRKRYQLGDPVKTIAAPYHLIYTYSEGQASYDAIRFCSKELRTHLPHIASALFYDSVDDQAIQKELKRFTEMIETTRNEFVSWVKESNINETLKDILTEKLRKVGVSFTTRESLQPDSFEEAHRHLNWPQIEAQSYQEMVPVIKNFLFKRLLDRLNSKAEALRSSVFAEASAANVGLEYSRLGNWLNVPSSLLTSPILASEDTPHTIIYSNLFWAIARELSKAIDSEGVLYNAVGVHKRGEADLKPLEQTWTEAQTCLEQNLHNTRRDGTTKAIVIRQSINEMVGFQVAYRCFDKKIKEVFGEDTRHHTKEDLQTMAVTNFFQTLTPIYCQSGERGASIILLDKFVDAYLKRYEILGCKKTYVNFDCEVLLADQL